jgi:hypothetical protein
MVHVLDILSGRSRSPRLTNKGLGSGISSSRNAINGSGASGPELRSRIQTKVRVLGFNGKKRQADDQPPHTLNVDEERADERVLRLPETRLSIT